MRTSELLFVGFATRVLEDIEPYLPEFEPNKTDKDPVAGALKKRNAFLECAPYTAHLCKLTSVVIASVKQQRFFNWALTEGEDTNLGTLFSGIFRQHYPTAFDPEGYFSGASIRLVGFDVREFVKLAGLEAAAGGQPLPTELWYGSDHRDMLPMILPDKAKDLDPLIAAKRLQLPYELFSQTAALYRQNSPAGATVRAAWSVGFTLQLQVFPHLAEELENLWHMAQILLQEEAAGESPQDVLAQAGDTASQDEFLAEEPAPPARRAKKRLSPPSK